ncbi:MAG TPA: amidohydrolase family protein [Acidimicrobiia bacterium]|jgi:predicted TIM-barrel fold metal-dependent hydrolase|nr:amidohydrolase family protein [Acidimicrobiia bacterium]
MTIRWRDEDPGLPIDFEQCSNGEYDPEPLTPVRVDAERTARRLIDDAIRKTGVSRREFLRSASALAICLASIDGAVSAARNLTPGLFYPFDPVSRHDTEAARAILGPTQWVFDVQGHLLEYDLDPSTRGDWFWGSQFPQARCEDEDDPRACFATNHFLEEIFIRSDTTMTALSGLPINPEGSPLSNEVMEETRQLVEALSGDERVVVNALALPQTAPIGAVLDEMTRTVEENQVAGWKTFTHFPSDIHWWLDDHDPDLPAVGNAFLDHLVTVGTPILFVHKGLSNRARYGSPVDVGPAAAAHPDVSFVVYHSGFEVALREGPYTEATADVGVNRLIASVRNAGIGPGQNVYAELGSTWWHLLRRPDEAAHVLGKLLVAFGEDNILWGTDSIFYGSPQGQIEAFRAFEIPEEMQARFGYPPLTRGAKAKILGWNAAALYGIDPITEPVGFTRDDLELARVEHPVPTRSWGPRTVEEVREFRAHHQGWP